MLEDRSIDVVHAALNGLAARQRAISDDIANVNTPYFRGRSVDFEASLREAVGDGSDPLSSPVSVTQSDNPMGLNFNNVDLANETLSGAKTQMSYDLMLRAAGDRFSLLRSAGKTS